jgi:hypothetical protein
LGARAFPSFIAVRNGVIVTITTIIEMIVG